MGPIPEGWLDYTPMGKRIEGTRFIAFKVPLMGMDLSEVAEDNRLIPEKLLTHVPNLGLIIDLTDTTRYYQPAFFVGRGLEYKKIAIRGRVLPPLHKHQHFQRVVDTFLEDNVDNDKLIGVHCTHGCNRTGLMICSYMVKSGKFTAATAIEAFESGRGHGIHRDNYIEAINNMSTKTAFDAVAPATIPRDITPVAWLNRQVGPDDFASDDLASISSGPDTPSIGQPGDPLPLHWIFCQRTQRQTASLHVEPHHLIPDGNGAYFVRVISQGNVPYSNGSMSSSPSPGMMRHPPPNWPRPPQHALKRRPDGAGTAPAPFDHSIKQSRTARGRGAKRGGH